MKILDRYIAKNFLIGYAIALSVMIGMRIVLDLFLQVDEFVENLADLGTRGVLKNVASYYGTQVALYYRDFAGMITVVAAVFTIGKMTRSRELIAVLASGVSLKRVIAPIIFLSVILMALLVIDQEFIIPKIANQLVRSHDAKPGEEFYNLWFVEDSQGSLFCCHQFEEKTSTMSNPLIILRQQTEDGPGWKVSAQIEADKAIYDEQLKKWKLTNGRYTKISAGSDLKSLDLQPKKVEFYQSDLTPFDIPLRQQEGYKELLSSAQLADLAKQRTRIKDLAELYFQKHSRITDPVINIIMLMVALPVLVCRDPKMMKTAIVKSFAITSACFIVNFICKILAPEVVFGQVRPEIWAWAPIFLFLPIAFIELDTMKT